MFSPEECRCILAQRDRQMEAAVELLDDAVDRWRERHEEEPELEGWQVEGKTGMDRD